MPVAQQTPRKVRKKNMMKRRKRKKKRLNEERCFLVIKQDFAGYLEMRETLASWLDG